MEMAYSVCGSGYAEVKYSDDDDDDEGKGVDGMRAHVEPLGARLKLLILLNCLFYCLFMLSAVFFFPVHSK